MVPDVLGACISYSMSLEPIIDQIDMQELLLWGWGGYVQMLPCSGSAGLGVR